VEGAGRRERRGPRVDDEEDEEDERKGSEGEERLDASSPEPFDEFLPEHYNS
jgi:hypothetical protein